MGKDKDQSYEDKLFLIGQGAHSHILELYPNKQRKLIPCACYFIQKEIWFIMFDDNEKDTMSLTNCIEEATLEYFNVLKRSGVKGQVLSSKDANKIEVIYADSQGMWSRVHFHKPVFSNPQIGVNSLSFRVKNWEHIHPEFLNLFKVLATGK